MAEGDGHVREGGAQEGGQRGGQADKERGEREKGRRAQAVNSVNTELNESFTQTILEILLFSSVKRFDFDVLPVLPFPYRGSAKAKDE